MDSNILLVISGIFVTGYLCALYEDERRYGSKNKAKANYAACVAFVASLYGIVEIGVRLGLEF